MTFTEDEERIIEVMARAACEAEEFDPEGPRYNSKRLNWEMFRHQARRHYAMQKAMMMGLNKTPVQWTE